MKTPLPYYGGKQRIAKRVVELMPPHTCYVEPFAGGLAVLFEKGLPHLTNSHNYREVINDADESIVNFWRELQREDSDLVRRAVYTPYSRSEYAKAMREKSAWATWVSTVQSFGNKKEGGWAIVTHPIPEPPVTLMRVSLP